LYSLSSMYITFLQFSIAGTKQSVVQHIDYADHKNGTKKSHCAC
jgi:hypothetical protein